MVETREQSRRMEKEWVPRITKIKEIIYPCDWKKRFNYPVIKESSADFFVIYESIKGLGGIYLIECAKSNLRTKIRQLDNSGLQFKKLNIKINNYLIVLEKLNKADQNKYSLVKHPTLKYAHEIKIKKGENLGSYLKINGKNIMLIYKKDINKFTR